jgi:hypothetical protein
MRAFFFKFSTYLRIFLGIWKSVIEYIQSVVYYIIYIIWFTCRWTLYYFFFQILKYVISDIEIRVLWNRHPFPPIDFYFYVLSINSYSSRKINVYLLAFSIWTINFTCTTVYWAPYVSHEKRLSIKITTQNCNALQALIPTDTC